jgi:riboflavin synthase
VCLTVVESSAGRFAVDAAFETLRATTIGSLRVGDPVNLEPALRVGDALGGHFVSGHVDGVAQLRSAAERGGARELWFDLPASLMPLVAPKGSICLEGVSLTVNEVDATGVMLGIIPHTLTATNLGRLRRGDRVNVEVDLLARYVARLVGVKPGAGVTWELLAEAGFIGSGRTGGGTQ